MPTSGIWQMAAGKRRELVWFLYPDEATPCTVDGAPFLRLALRIDRETLGRFTGLVVADADETTEVYWVDIDGTAVWSGSVFPGDGEVLEAPRPVFVHPGSVVLITLRGRFARVLFIVEKAEPVRLPQKEQRG